MDFVGSSNFFYWRRFLQFPWDWEPPSNSQYSFLIEAFGLHTKNNFRIKKCHGKWTKKCMQWNKKIWNIDKILHTWKNYDEKCDQDRWGEMWSRKAMRNTIKTDEEKSSEITDVLPDMSTHAIPTLSSATLYIENIGTTTTTRVDIWRHQWDQRWCKIFALV